MLNDKLLLMRIRPHCIYYQYDLAKGDRKEYEYLEP